MASLRKSARDSIQSTSTSSKLRHSVAKSVKSKAKSAHKKKKTVSGKKVICLSEEKSSRDTKKDVKNTSSRDSDKGATEKSINCVTNQSFTNKTTTTRYESANFPLDLSDCLQDASVWEAMEIRFLENDTCTVLRPKLCTSASTEDKSQKASLLETKRPTLGNKNGDETNAKGYIRRQTVCVEKVHVKNLLNTKREKCGNLSSSRLSEYRPPNVYSAMDTCTNAEVKMGYRTVGEYRSEEYFTDTETFETVYESDKPSLIFGRNSDSQSVADTNSTTNDMSSTANETHTQLITNTKARKDDTSQLSQSDWHSGKAEVAVQSCFLSDEESEAVDKYTADECSCAVRNVSFRKLGEAKTKGGQKRKIKETCYRAKNSYIKPGKTVVIKQSASASGQQVEPSQSFSITKPNGDYKAQLKWPNVECKVFEKETSTDNTKASSRESSVEFTKDSSAEFAEESSAELCIGSSAEIATGSSVEREGDSSAGSERDSSVESTVAEKRVPPDKEPFKNIFLSNYKSPTTYSRDVSKNWEISPKHSSAQSSNSINNFSRQNNISATCTNAKCRHSSHPDQFFDDYRDFSYRNKTAATKLRKVTEVEVSQSEDSKIKQNVSNQTVHIQNSAGITESTTESVSDWSKGSEGQGVENLSRKSPLPKDSGPPFSPLSGAEIARYKEIALQILIQRKKGEAYKAMTKRADDCSTSTVSKKKHVSTRKRLTRPEAKSDVKSEGMKSEAKSTKTDKSDGVQQASMETARISYQDQHVVSVSRRIHNQIEKHKKRLQQAKEIALEKEKSECEPNAKTKKKTKHQNTALHNKADEPEVVKTMKTLKHRIIINKGMVSAVTSDTSSVLSWNPLHTGFVSPGQKIAVTSSKAVVRSRADEAQSGHAVKSNTTTTLSTTKSNCQCVKSSDDLTHGSSNAADATDKVGHTKPEPISELKRDQGGDQRWSVPNSHSVNRNILPPEPSAEKTSEPLQPTNPNFKSVDVLSQPLQSLDIPKDHGYGKDLTIQANMGHDEFFATFKDDDTRSSQGSLIAKRPIKYFELLHNILKSPTARATQALGMFLQKPDALASAERELDITVDQIINSYQEIFDELNTISGPVAKPGTSQPHFDLQLKMDTQHRMNNLARNNILQRSDKSRNDAEQPRDVLKNDVDKYQRSNSAVSEKRTRTPNPSPAGCQIPDKKVLISPKVVPSFTVRHIEDTMKRSGESVKLLTYDTEKAVTPEDMNMIKSATRPPRIETSLPTKISCKSARQHFCSLMGESGMGKKDLPRYQLPTKSSNGKVLMSLSTSSVHQRKRSESTDRHGGSPWSNKNSRMKVRKSDGAVCSQVSSQRKMTRASSLSVTITTKSSGGNSPYNPPAVTGVDLSPGSGKMSLRQHSPMLKPSKDNPLQTLLRYRIGRKETSPFSTKPHPDHTNMHKIFHSIQQRFQPSRSGLSGTRRAHSGITITTPPLGLNFFPVTPGLQGPVGGWDNSQANSDEAEKLNPAKKSLPDLLVTKKSFISVSTSESRGRAQTESRGPTTAVTPKSEEFAMRIESSSNLPAANVTQRASKTEQNKDKDSVKSGGTATKITKLTKTVGSNLRRPLQMPKSKKCVAYENKAVPMNADLLTTLAATYDQNVNTEGKKPEFVNPPSCARNTIQQRRNLKMKDSLTERFESGFRRQWQNEKQLAGIENYRAVTEVTSGEKQKHKLNLFSTVHRPALTGSSAAKEAMVLSKNGQTVGSVSEPVLYKIHKTQSNNKHNLGPQPALPPADRRSVSLTLKKSPQRINKLASQSSSMRMVKSSDPIHNQAKKCVSTSDIVTMTKRPKTPTVKAKDAMRTDWKPPQRRRGQRSATRSGRKSQSEKSLVISAVKDSESIAASGSWSRLHMLRKRGSSLTNTVTRAPRLATEARSRKTAIDPKNILKRRSRSDECVGLSLEAKNKSLPQRKKKLEASDVVPSILVSLNSSPELSDKEDTESRYGTVCNNITFDLKGLRRDLTLDDIVCQSKDKSHLTDDDGINLGMEIAHNAQGINANSPPTPPLSARSPPTLLKTAHNSRMSLDGHSYKVTGPEQILLKKIQATYGKKQQASDEESENSDLLSFQTLRKRAVDKTCEMIINESKLITGGKDLPSPIDPVGSESLLELSSPEKTNSREKTTDGKPLVTNESVKSPDSRPWVTKGLKVVISPNDTRHEIAQNPVPKQRTTLIYALDLSSKGVAPEVILETALSQARNNGGENAISVVHIKTLPNSTDLTTNELMNSKLTNIPMAAKVMSPPLIGVIRSPKKRGQGFKGQAKSGIDQSPLCGAPSEQVQSPDKFRDEFSQHTIYLEEEDKQFYLDDAEYSHIPKSMLSLRPEALNISPAIIMPVNEIFKSPPHKTMVNPNTRKQKSLVSEKNAARECAEKDINAQATLIKKVPIGSDIEVLETNSNTVGPETVTRVHTRKSHADQLNDDVGDLYYRRNIVHDDSVVKSEKFVSHFRNDCRAKDDSGAGKNKRDYDAEKVLECVSINRRNEHDSSSTTETSPNLKEFKYSQRTTESLLSANKGQNIGTTKKGDSEKVASGSPLHKHPHLQDVNIHRPMSADKTSHGGREGLKHVTERELSVVREATQELSLQVSDDPCKSTDNHQIFFYGETTDEQSSGVEFKQDDCHNTTSLERTLIKHVDVSGHSATGEITMDLYSHKQANYTETTQHKNVLETELRYQATLESSKDIHRINDSNETSGQLIATRSYSEIIITPNLIQTSCVTMSSKETTKSEALKSSQLDSLNAKADFASIWSDPKTERVESRNPDNSEGQSMGLALNQAAAPESSRNTLLICNTVQTCKKAQLPSRYPKNQNTKDPIPSHDCNTGEDRLKLNKSEELKNSDHFSSDSANHCKASSEMDTEPCWDDGNKKLTDHPDTRPQTRTEMGTLFNSCSTPSPTPDTQAFHHQQELGMRIHIALEEIVACKWKPFSGHMGTYSIAIDNFICGRVDSVHLNESLVAMRGPGTIQDSGTNDNKETNEKLQDDGSGNGNGDGRDNSNDKDNRGGNDNGNGKDKGSSRDNGSGKDNSSGKNNDNDKDNGSGKDKGSGKNNSRGKDNSSSKDIGNEKDNGSGKDNIRSKDFGSGKDNGNDKDNDKGKGNGSGKDNGIGKDNCCSKDIGSSKATAGKVDMTRPGEKSKESEITKSIPCEHTIAKLQSKDVTRDKREVGAPNMNDAKTGLGARLRVLDMDDCGATVMSRSSSKGVVRADGYFNCLQVKPEVCISVDIQTEVTRAATAKQGGEDKHVRKICIDSHSCATQWDKNRDRSVFGNEVTHSRKPISQRDAPILISEERNTSANSDGLIMKNIEKVKEITTCSKIEKTAERTRNPEDNIPTREAGGMRNGFQTEEGNLEKEGITASNGINREHFEKQGFLVHSLSVTRVLVPSYDQLSSCSVEDAGHRPTFPRAHSTDIGTNVNSSGSSTPSLSDEESQDRVNAKPFRVLTHSGPINYKYIHQKALENLESFMKTAKRRADTLSSPPKTKSRPSIVRMYSSYPGQPTKPSSLQTFISGRDCGGSADSYMTTNELCERYEHDGLPPDETHVTDDLITCDDLSPLLIGSKDEEGDLIGPHTQFSLINIQESRDVPSERRRIHDGGLCYGEPRLREDRLYSEREKLVNILFPELKSVNNTKMSFFADPLVPRDSRSKGSAQLITSNIWRGAVGQLERKKNDHTDKQMTKAPLLNYQFFKKSEQSISNQEQQMLSFCSLPGCGDNSSQCDLCEIFPSTPFKDSRNQCLSTHLSSRESDLQQQFGQKNSLLPRNPNYPSPPTPHNIRNLLTHTNTTVNPRLGSFQSAARFDPNASSVPARPRLFKNNNPFVSHAIHNPFITRFETLMTSSPSNSENTIMPTYTSSVIPHTNGQQTHHGNPICSHSTIYHPKAVPKPQIDTPKVGPAEPSQKPAGFVITSEELKYFFGSDNVESSDSSDKNDSSQKTHNASPNTTKEQLILFSEDSFAERQPKEDGSRLQTHPNIIQSSSKFHDENDVRLSQFQFESERVLGLSGQRVENLLPLRPINKGSAPSPETPKTSQCCLGVGGEVNGHYTQLEGRDEHRVGSHYEMTMSAFENSTENFDYTSLSVSTASEKQLAKICSNIDWSSMDTFSLTKLPGVESSKISLIETTSSATSFGQDDTEHSSSWTMDEQPSFSFGSEAPLLPKRGRVIREVRSLLRPTPTASKTRSSTDCDSEDSENNNHSYSEHVDQEFLDSVTVLTSRFLSFFLGIETEVKRKHAGKKKALKPKTLCKQRRCAANIYRRHAKDSEHKKHLKQSGGHWGRKFRTLKFRTRRNGQPNRKCYSEENFLNSSTSTQVSRESLSVTGTDEDTDDKRGAATGNSAEKTHDTCSDVLVSMEAHSPGTHTLLEHDSEETVSSASKPPYEDVHISSSWNGIHLGSIDNLIRMFMNRTSAQHHYLKPKNTPHRGQFLDVDTDGNVIPTNHVLTREDHPEPYPGYFTYNSLFAEEPHYPDIESLIHTVYDNDADNRIRDADINCFFNQYHLPMAEATLDHSDLCYGFPEVYDCSYCFRLGNEFPLEISSSLLPSRARKTTSSSPRPQLQTLFIILGEDEAGADTEFLDHEFDDSETGHQEERTCRKAKDASDGMQVIQTRGARALEKEMIIKQLEGTPTDKANDDVQEREAAGTASLSEARDVVYQTKIYEQDYDGEIHEVVFLTKDLGEGVAGENQQDPQVTCRVSCQPRKRKFSSRNGVDENGGRFYHYHLKEDDHAPPLKRKKLGLTKQLTDAYHSTGSQYQTRSRAKFVKTDCADQQVEFSEQRSPSPRVSPACKTLRSNNEGHGRAKFNRDTESTCKLNTFRKVNPNVGKNVCKKRSPLARPAGTLTRTLSFIGHEDRFNHTNVDSTIMSEMQTEFNEDKFTRSYHEKVKTKLENQYLLDDYELDTYEELGSLFTEMQESSSSTIFREDVHAAEMSESQIFSDISMTSTSSQVSSEVSSSHESLPHMRVTPTISAGTQTIFTVHKYFSDATNAGRMLEGQNTNSSGGEDLKHRSRVKIKSRLLRHKRTRQVDSSRLETGDVLSLRPVVTTCFTQTEVSAGKVTDLSFVKNECHGFSNIRDLMTKCVHSSSFRCYVQNIVDERMSTKLHFDKLDQRKESMSAEGATPGASLGKHVSSKCSLRWVSADNDYDMPTPVCNGSDENIDDDIEVMTAQIEKASQTASMHGLVIGVLGHTPIRFHELKSQRRSPEAGQSPAIISEIKSNTQDDGGQRVSESEKHKHFSVAKHKSASPLCVRSLPRRKGNSNLKSSSSAVIPSNDSADQCTGKKLPSKKYRKPLASVSNTSAVNKTLLGQFTPELKASQKETEMKEKPDIVVTENEHEGTPREMSVQVGTKTDTETQYDSKLISANKNVSDKSIEVDENLEAVPKKNRSASNSSVSSGSLSGTSVDYGKLKNVLSTETKMLWKSLTRLEKNSDHCRTCRLQYISLLPPTLKPGERSCKDCREAKRNAARAGGESKDAKDKKRTSWRYWPESEKNNTAAKQQNQNDKPSNDMQSEQCHKPSKDGDKISPHRFRSFQTECATRAEISRKIRAGSVRGQNLARMVNLFEKGSGFHQDDIKFDTLSSSASNDRRQGVHEDLDFNGTTSISDVDAVAQSAIANTPSADSAGYVDSDLMNVSLEACQDTGNKDGISGKGCNKNCFEVSGWDKVSPGKTNSQETLKKRRYEKTLLGDSSEGKPSIHYFQQNHDQQLISPDKVKADPGSEQGTPTRKSCDSADIWIERLVNILHEMHQAFPHTANHGSPSQNPTCYSTVAQLSVIPMQTTQSQPPTRGTEGVPKTFDFPLGGGMSLASYVQGAHLMRTSYKTPQYLERLLETKDTGLSSTDTIQKLISSNTQTDDLIATSDDSLGTTIKSSQFNGAPRNVACDKKLTLENHLAGKGFCQARGFYIDTNVPSNRSSTQNDGQSSSLVDSMVRELIGKHNQDGGRSEQTNPATGVFMQIGDQYMNICGNRASGSHHYVSYQDTSNLLGVEWVQKNAKLNTKRTIPLKCCESQNQQELDLFKSDTVYTQDHFVTSSRSIVFSRPQEIDAKRDAPVLKTNPSKDEDSETDRSFQTFCATSDLIDTAWRVPSSLSVATDHLMKEDMIFSNIRGGMKNVSSRVQRLQTADFKLTKVSVSTRKFRLRKSESMAELGRITHLNKSFNAPLSFDDGKEMNARNRRPETAATRSGNCDVGVTRKAWGSERDILGGKSRKQIKRRPSRSWHPGFLSAQRDKNSVWTKENSTQCRLGSLSSPNDNLSESSRPNSNSSIDNRMDVKNMLSENKIAAHISRGENKSTSTYMSSESKSTATHLSRENKSTVTSLSSESKSTATHLTNESKTTATNLSSESKMAVNKIISENKSTATNLSSESKSTATTVNTESISTEANLSSENNIAIKYIYVEKISNLNDYGKALVAQDKINSVKRKPDVCAHSSNIRHELRSQICLHPHFPEYNCTIRENNFNSITKPDIVCITLEPNSDGDEIVHDQETCAVNLYVSSCSAESEASPVESHDPIESNDQFRCSDRVNSVEQVYWTEAGDSTLQASYSDPVYSDKSSVESSNQENSSETYAADLRGKFSTPSREMEKQSRRTNVERLGLSPLEIPVDIYTVPLWKLSSPEFQQKKKKNKRKQDVAMRTVVISGPLSNFSIPVHRHVSQKLEGSDSNPMSASGNSPSCGNIEPAESSSPDRLPIQAKQPADDHRVSSGWMSTVRKILPFRKRSESNDKDRKHAV